MDLISVIVPVYKAEKYINRCVDSILNQTYTNLEIILVDDGSPDNCGAICDEYAQKDSRVKAVHKENGGASQARNYGLKYAAGDYVTFVDSDDHINEKYAEKMMAGFDKDTDVVICMYRKIFTQSQKEKEFISVSQTETEEINNDFDFCRHDTNFLSTCKLYKKSVISGLTFNENYYLGEDTLFFANVCQRIKKIKYLPDCLYDYYIYEESLSNGAINSKKTLVISAWSEIYNLFPKDSVSYQTCKGRYYDLIRYIYSQSGVQFGFNCELCKDLYSKYFGKKQQDFKTDVIFSKKSKLIMPVFLNCRHFYNVIYSLYDKVLK